MNHRLQTSCPEGLPHRLACSEAHCLWGVVLGREKSALGLGVVLELALVDEVVLTYVGVVGMVQLQILGFKGLVAD